MNRVRARRRFLLSGAAMAASVIPVGANGEHAPVCRLDDATSIGQRPLFLVFYRPGPKWVPGKHVTRQPLKAHFNYYFDLHRRGQVRGAGRFDADGAAGAAVFEADDLEQAKAIVAADPAVVEEIFVAELHRWVPVPWQGVQRMA
jgi:uncharacterized protein YciI